MESLGVLGVINEMLLKSWDGNIVLFPHWPHQIDTGFTTLRAEGALLISAAMQQGSLTSLEVHAEKDGECEIIFENEKFNLKYEAGKSYRIR